MRFVKVLAALVLCAAALLSGSVTAFADTDVSGSAWDMLLYEEGNISENEYWINRLRLKRLDVLPKQRIGNRLIDSYDVSQSGWVVILFANQDLVAVYDEFFEFQYAISFVSDSAYGVLWKDEYVALISCRGQSALILNDDAVPVAWFKNLAAKDGTDYWGDIVNKRSRRCGEYTYFCYSRSESSSSRRNSEVEWCHVLERTDKNGNAEILYEEEEYWWEPVLSFVLIIAVLSLIIFRVHRTNKMKAQAIIKRHYQEGNGVGYTPPLRKV